jgi:hypothetical protein
MIFWFNFQTIVLLKCFIIKLGQFKEEEIMKPCNVVLEKVVNLFTLFQII